MARIKYLSLLLLPLFTSCSTADWWWNDDSAAAEAPTYSQTRDRVHMAAARRYLASGNSASARRELMQLSAGAHGTDVSLLLAESFLREGDLASADAELTVASESAPLDPRVDMLRGVLSESVGDWLEAVKAYQSASSKDASDNRPVLSLARMYHASGDGVRATSYLERELSVRPMDFELSLAAGRAYQSVGSHFDAITHFSVANEMEPFNMAAREGLIMSLSLAGQHGEALYMASDLLPNELGEATCLALGRSALLAGESFRSVDMLTRYLHKFQKDSNAWLDLSRAYYLADNLQMALQASGRTLKLDPHNYAAYTMIGHVRLRADQFELAFKAYNTAILSGGDAFLLTELMDRATEAEKRVNARRGEL